MIEWICLGWCVVLSYFVAKLISKSYQHNQLLVMLKKESNKNRWENGHIFCKNIDGDFDCPKRRDK